MTKYSETLENYLKVIYLISKENRGGWVSNSEISRLLHIKPASVTNMLYKLKEKGFVDWRPRKALRLTVKGKTIALDVIERYNNLQLFFKSVLHLEDESLVKKLCCEIEHHLTPEVSQAFLNLYFKLN